jgi:hypothetical protein
MKFHVDYSVVRSLSSVWEFFGCGLPILQYRLNAKIRVFEAFFFIFEEQTKSHGLLGIV